MIRNSRWLNLVSYFRAYLSHRDPFAASLKHYSVEYGSFNWSDVEGGYHSEENIFWARGVKEDESFGRAAADGYTGIDYIGSLGWRQLIGFDLMFITFNSGSKALPFNLAIEGTMDGIITAEDGMVVERIQRNKDESEGILKDLNAYVQKLGADIPDTPENYPKAGPLFRAAYDKLHADEATADDLCYQPLWVLANRYLGKRAPLSRALRLRTLLGKETVVVATPEAIKKSNYKHFLD
jgi:hypothetical protein